MSTRLSAEIVDTATFLWGLLGLAGLPAAGFSVMMFDAPGSDRFSTYLLAASVMSFPLVCLTSISLSLRALRSGTPRAACAWTLLPLANVVLFAAGMTWISVFQGGRFNG